MRRFILGIVILVAVPAYAVGQQRDRGERTSTGRTAVPREGATQAAPARNHEDTKARSRDHEDTKARSRDHEDTRARSRDHEDTRARSGNHEDTRARSGNHEDATARSQSREDTRRRSQSRQETRTRSRDDEDTKARTRGSTSAAETVRERLRDERPRGAAARTYWTNSPRLPGGPASIALPNTGLRPFPDRTQRRPGDVDGDYRPRYRRPYGGANVLFVPYAAPVVVEREVIVEREVVDATAAEPVIVEQPSLARLILDIHPPSAQVFADGYYIGIPEDFRFEDGGAVLEPGPHRIDIIARGYEPVTFDVNLTRGQSATFRHILTPITRQAPAPDAAVKTPPVPKQPATFYLIPGCYMGNVPPREANLPATCDVARAVSVQY